MNRKIILLLLILIAFPNVNFSQKKKRVKASYYAHYFHGRTTANGEKFDMYAMTCAHKKLPFNTILKVRNLKNDRVIYVRVNDRGPYIKGRSIDLSYQAAKELDMVKYGVITVEYEIVDKIPDPNVEKILIFNEEKLNKILQDTTSYFFNLTKKNNLDTLKLQSKIKRDSLLQIKKEKNDSSPFNLKIIKDFFKRLVK